MQPRPLSLPTHHAAADSIPAMDGPCGTPPSPPYSAPSAAADGAVPQLPAPNPSGVAAAWSNLATARVLFVPPRPMHPSGAQLPPLAPKVKGAGAKLSAAVVDLPKPPRSWWRRWMRGVPVLREPNKRPEFHRPRRMVHRRQGCLLPLQLWPACARC
jgi:hypothetical protein